ncbi:hypothetical protein HN954_02755 [bacterium]|jgi:hypothetical protein|nr:hypothetical protein [bacterium]MBT6831678.1 hypothetical protein [bacterium]MBT6996324.1 hypothetical protein [bacterium]MBT7773002.1 hypothetical protein [bacterium]
MKKVFLIVFVGIFVLAGVVFFSAENFRASVFDDAWLSEGLDEFHTNFPRFSDVEKKESASDFLQQNFETWETEQHAKLVGKFDDEKNLIPGEMLQMDRNVAAHIEKIKTMISTLQNVNSELKNTQEHIDQTCLKQNSSVLCP